MKKRGEQPWYFTPRPQELPLALSLPDAARLCGLSVGAAYYLARSGDWQPFIKHYGTKGMMLVRTAGLLKWLECDGVPVPVPAEAEGETK